LEYQIQTSSAILSRDSIYIYIYIYIYIERERERERGRGRERERERKAKTPQTFQSFCIQNKKQKKFPKFPSVTYPHATGRQYISKMTFMAYI
jgi:hypothetical protein